MILISAFVNASGTILFVVPQGMGVTEVGTGAAFTLLGLPFESGILFGLIRRSRVVFWALLGLAVQLPVWVLGKRRKTVGARAE